MAPPMHSQSCCVGSTRHLRTSSASSSLGILERSNRRGTTLRASLPPACASSSLMSSLSSQSFQHRRFSQLSCFTSSTSIFLPTQISSLPKRSPQSSKLTGKLQASAHHPSDAAPDSNPPKDTEKQANEGNSNSSSAGRISFDAIFSRTGLPGMSMSRRNMIGFSAAILGAAAAETTGLNKAIATTASLVAPPEKGAGDTQGAEGIKSLLPQVEKSKESRVYDASVLGEPLALTNKTKAWQKMLNSRVVYLGEAERVHDPTEKVLELEIIRKLRDECFAQARPVTVAFSAFPRPMQPDLDAYFGNKLSVAELREKVSYWPAGRWEETFPILRYCKESGVRLYAAGVPPAVLRTVQSKGIHGLSTSDRRKYAPAARGGTSVVPLSKQQQQQQQQQQHSAASASALPIPDSFLESLFPSLVNREANAEGIGFDSLFPKTSHAFGTGPYLFAQARVVEQHTMSQAVSQAMADGSSVGLLIVITGASHVLYGARGKGVPSKVDTKQKKQAVVLLNPERQVLRSEGSLPEADYLWYAGTRACTRNCFDRAEVARVMGAAGRRREALPQDLQMGLERGLISPETLQSFFELESQPWIAEATKRFQGLRERFYADPRFLNRLFIEEAISITTSLIAQYNRRGPRFWSEIEFVTTDIVRGAVVDFFTVWLPAPTLSFDSKAMDPANQLNHLGSPGSPNIWAALTRWISTLPDNAFQRPSLGQEWSLTDRFGAVMIGGVKLAAVGFVSSVGTVGVNNGLQGVRKILSGEKREGKNELKRSPVLKTALVYGGFLGTSANLRYQVIAGAVEHWVADYFLASQPAAGAALSFVARTANSYFGTGQWVDLAQRFGLQAHAEEPPEPRASDVAPKILPEAPEPDLRLAPPVPAELAFVEVPAGSGTPLLEGGGGGGGLNVHALVVESMEKSERREESSISETPEDEREGEFVRQEAGSTSECEGEGNAASSASTAAADSESAEVGGRAPLGTNVTVGELSEVCDRLERALSLEATDHPLLVEERVTAVEESEVENRIADASTAEPASAGAMDGDEAFVVRGRDCGAEPAARVEGYSPGEETSSPMGLDHRKLVIVLEDGAAAAGNSHTIEIPIHPAVARVELNPKTGIVEIVGPGEGGMGVTVGEDRVLEGVIGSFELSTAKVELLGEMRQKVHLPEGVEEMDGSSRA